ncbi:hypothetical protein ACJMK2_043769 [Sinanodonta woodiana]|uniref:UBA domain-containing protein n=1 Tax=Sinanodonta woodiana TaxID=1069815 RepID=A0ABD3VYR0_SINWO
MMSATLSASRANSRPSKDKKVLTQQQTQNVKSEGPPSKVQATPEQIRLAQVLAEPISTDESALQEKIRTVKELTGCSDDQVLVALHDCKNDVEIAVNKLLEDGDGDQGEWRESGKKKKKVTTAVKTDLPPMTNHVNEKPEKRENTQKDEQEIDKEFKPENSYRPRGRRDNRPPRLSRGRGQNRDRGERENRDDDGENRDENSRDRGRGRGRGFGGPPRRGRGRSFRNSQPRFDKGPQIDTWTNETAENADKEPKITNWSDTVAEDWNEDIDSWTGSLAESKVFTASSVQNTVEHPVASPITNTTNSISSSFDIEALLAQNKVQNDITDEANYITQFNQRATESIKNSIGIGSNSQQGLPHSLTSVSSQTASNVNALVSLTQKAMQQDGSLTGGNLSGSAGSNLAGSSLTANSLSASIAGSSLVSQSLTSQSVVSQTALPSQSSILQQRPKQQRTKLPPPSKIPASAVEMPGHMITKLDLEFGADSSPFSFGANDSGTNTYSNNSVTTNTSSKSTHQSTKPSDSVIPSSILSQSSSNHGGISRVDQTSPRAGLYQSSSYTTPPKKDPTTGLSQTNKIPLPDPLPMPPSQSDMKTSPLLSGQMSGQGTNSLSQASLPSSKMETGSLSSFPKNNSYQQTPFQSHKPGSYNASSNTQPGSYPNQFPSGNSRSQPPSSKPYQSSHNQYPSSTASQFQSTQSQYPASPSQYQTGQTQYQSTGSQYQTSQQQYPPSQSGYQTSQFQNYQTGSAFQTQSGYSSNQSNQNSLYQVPTTTSSFTQQTGPSSLYHQTSAQTSTFQSQSAPSYLTRDTQSGSSYQSSPSQSSTSPYKDNQSVPSSYSRDTQSASSYRDGQTNSSSFRDGQSSSSYRENQSSANSYRDSQSAPGSYRDSQSAPSSYQRESSSGLVSSTSQPSSYQRDSQSSLGSSTNQPSSYQRDSQTGLSASSNQNQSTYNSKSYVVSGTSPLNAANKLGESLTKMSVKDTSSLDSLQPSTPQFDSSSSASVLSTTSSVTVTTSPAAGTTSSTTSSQASTTVTSSSVTKVSTLSTNTSKAPPNLPPGVPLLGQYIMGQGALPPYFGLQQPVYANYEDLQLLQQRLPTLANNFQPYELSGFAVPTTLTARDQQSIPNAPYSGTVTGDASKLNQVDAHSPIPSTQQSAAAGQSTAHQQQQPFIHLNYSYYYPSMLPGGGFQYPMFAMPQGTNSPAAPPAHGATTANSQFQKSYGTHMYGTTKVYDDLNQAADFKSAYGVSQTQAKGTAGTSLTSGNGSSDIPIPGYGPGKSHATLAVPGTQAGPLGAPTTPYGTTFMPMMTHQTHSQMMHHQLQDSTATTTRGNQQPGSQAKTGGKNYANPYWSSS